MARGQPAIRVLVAVDTQVDNERLQQQLDASSMVKVVGRSSRPFHTLMMANELQVDVVLLPGEEDDSMPGVCTHLLHQIPDLVVIAVAPIGSHAMVFRRTITAAKIDGILAGGLENLLDGLIV